MLVRPSPGPVSSAGSFGWRQLPNEKPTYHGGIDFVGALGSPIRAVKDGTVFVAAPNGTYNRYGNLVVIKHNDPSEAPFSLYAHMNSLRVRKGQKVRAGQLVGTMGNTSADRCSGQLGCDPNHKVATHLHFELLKAFPAMPDVGRIDPTAYLSPGLQQPVATTPKMVFAASSPALYPAVQGPIQYPSYSGPLAGLGSVRWTTTVPRPFATAPGAGGLGAQAPIGSDPLSLEPGMDPTLQLVIMLGLLPFAVAALRGVGLLEAHP